VTAQRVVMVGAGLGGLTTAALLARLGCAVTVLERHAHCGGVMRGFTRDGVHCPVGVHLFGGINPGEPLHVLWQRLGLLDRIRFEQKKPGEVFCRCVFPDGETDFLTGLDEFSADLTTSFPDEGPAVEAILATLRETAARLGAWRKFFFGDFDSISWVMPMGRWLDELGCSPRLRRALALVAPLVGVPLSRLPRALFFTTLASYVLSPCTLQTTGNEFVAALVADVENAGGVVRTAAPVKRVVGADSVTGVELENGDILPADIAVLATHPARSLEMVEGLNLAPRFTGKLAALENTPGGFMVFATATGTPAAALGVPVIHINDEIEMLWCQWHPTAVPGRQLLTLIANHPWEKWAAWENTSLGRRGSAYLAAKNEAAEKHLRQAASCLGPLGEVKIVEICTPLSFRDWTGNPGGALYGVAQNYRQATSIARLRRKSLPGLRFTGQNLFGPGLLGTALAAVHTAVSIVGREPVESLLAGSN
jgi:phytoene dehydrogenase-like protein